MNKPGDLESLLTLLRNTLGSDDLALLESNLHVQDESAYDAVLERVAAKARTLESEVWRNRSRVESRYLNLLEDHPSARRSLLLRNSPPPLLLALTHSLIEQSFSKRFGEVDKALKLAELAVEAARAVGNSMYLSADAAADLQAEALAHLGNAYRINSDYYGAEAAFESAESWRAKGTGGRELKATLLGFRAALRFDQGRAEKAAALHNEEIALRRLVGNREALGIALVTRGVVAAWSEPLPIACRFLREGVELVEGNPSVMLAGLLAIAEILARESHGFEAWKALCRADTALLLLGNGEQQLLRRYRWIRGLTYRSIGEFESAEHDLRSVREDFSSQSLSIPAAVVSLDLASVYAASANYEAVHNLASEALAVFRSERVERRVLTALLVLQRAAEEKTLTETLALKVANFIARYQHNRSLRF